jgi:hypothetical protein
MLRPIEAPALSVRKVKLKFLPIVLKLLVQAGILSSCGIRAPLERIKT